MSYEDFDNRTKIEEIYCKEVANALLSYMDASAVQVFDFALRKRHADWPEKSSDEIDSGDANDRSTRELIKTLNPSNSEKLLSGRYMYLK
ncbi:unnamed protein product [Alternaria alternata]